MTTITAPTTGRPTLRQDLDAAIKRHMFTARRLTDYALNPALDAAGQPLPVPMRFRISHATATRKLAAAAAAYDARYGK